MLNDLIKKPELIILYTDQALYLKKDGIYNAPSFLKIVEKFGDKIKLTLLCVKAIDNPGTYDVDLSSINVVKFATLESTHNLYSFRLFGIMMRIYRAMSEKKRARCTVIIVDFTPVNNVLHIIFRVLQYRVVYYIRGDVEKEIRSRKKHMLKKILAEIYITYIRVMQKSLLSNKPLIVAGEGLKEKFKEITQLCHVFTATHIIKDDIVDYLDVYSREIGLSINILYVGNLFEYKGIDFIFQAVAHASQRIKDLSFSITIVGSGNYGKSLREHAKELGITDRVHFLGKIDKWERLKEIYREANVFVLASTTEGSPKVIPEAFSAALPVIATNVGGVSKLVNTGYNGYLVEKNSVEQIYNSLIEIFKDETKYREMCCAARDSAFLMTIDTEIEKVEKFLDAV